MSDLRAPFQRDFQLVGNRAGLDSQREIQAVTRGIVYEAALPFRRAQKVEVLERIERAISIQQLGGAGVRSRTGQRTPRQTFEPKPEGSPTDSSDSTTEAANQ